MGNNSAGSVGSGNEGQTDMGRGNTSDFKADKSSRKTGRLTGEVEKSNANTVDGNKRAVSDPRLTP